MNPTRIEAENRPETANGVGGQLGRTWPLASLRHDSSAWIASGEGDGYPA